MLSVLNMNTLHLHATDDEAWRLQIPSLPELTDYGGYRCANYPVECLEPQFGSGPFKTSKQNGFLSVSDYTELLRYAKSNKVSIIIEINGPGHARAAIKVKGGNIGFQRLPIGVIFGIIWK